MPEKLVLIFSKYLHYYSGEFPRIKIIRMNDVKTHRMSENG